jgi:hypothetical protein
MFSKSDLTVRKVLFDTSDSNYYRVTRVIPNSNTLFLSSFSKDLVPLSLPEQYSIPALLKRIDSKEVLLMDSDPFMKYESIEKLSEAQKKLMNRAWTKIKPIVTGNANNIFTRNRFKLIQQLSLEEPKASEPSIIKWIKNYFCAGMLKTALVADFKKCGAPGQKKSTRKISDALVDLIVTGFFKYYLNSEAGDTTIEQARLKTLEHWDKSVHGDIHFDYDTFRRYAVNAFPNHFENKVYRLGRKNAMRTSRLRLGKTGDIVTGAGILYQIDWTGLDVNLVAGFNRNLFLGKPILYCVVDSYSHLLVGILITFEKASWSTFMHALYNSVLNKVKFAARYGLTTLREGDWLGECLPEEIIADNGEAGSIIADELGDAFGIALGNVESYRGDLKGVCENMHKLIKEKINENFTGSGLTNFKYSKRLGVDGREEACLTLSELYQVAIKAAILQNELTLLKYPNNQDILSSLVKKTPNAIWTWSRNEGDGIPDACNETILFRELIDKRELTPNVKGFELYENQFFVPEYEVDQKLLENLINNPSGAGKQIIIYDKTYFKNKYWIHNERMIPLRKAGQEEQEYENIYEMIAVAKYYRNERKDDLTKEDLAKMKFSKETKKIISNGKQEQGNSRVQFQETDVVKRLVIETEKASVFKHEASKIYADERSIDTEGKSIDELDDEYLMSSHADELKAFDNKNKINQ